MYWLAGFEKIGGRLWSVWKTSHFNNRVVKCNVCGENMPGSETWMCYAANAPLVDYIGHEEYLRRMMEDV